MKRRIMNKSQSRKVFKKYTGVQAMNNMNPRTLRGGIRL